MNQSLYHLLKHAAAVKPNAVALRMLDRTLSYQELLARVGAIASYLRARGLRRPDRVGILMERSFDSIAAVHGALAAGGVYVPLDASASAERSAIMLRNAGARFLLTDMVHTEKSLEIADRHEDLSVVVGMGEGPSPSWQSIYQGGNGVPDVGLVECDLAVMFHTSGTTGVPKGVVHSHRSMLSVVEWAVDQFSLGEDDVFIAVTSHSFELSWFELYASLLARGELLLAPEDVVKFSPVGLAALAARHHVSVWCSVPSLLMRLSERGELETHDFAALRRINFAGERYPTRQLRRLMGQLPKVRFCNMLGTTETHICAFRELDAGLPEDSENIPVGRACAHLNLGAIGRDGSLVADGDIGELIVRGPNLMSGYWRLPERTAQVMVDVRFGPDLVGRAYRTGDLVRKDEQGDYHIVGRADRRTKVSGYLVDLDEVEAVILAHAGVLEGAVYTVETDSNIRVHAAVVPRIGSNLTPAALRVHIARIMPLHQVPEKIRFIDALPRLGNGKISRRAVQDAASGESMDAVGSQLPVGNIETLRRFICEEILQEPENAIDDAADFLSSLDIVRVVGFIELNLGLPVPNNEFVQKNFRSLLDMRRLLDRLSARREPA